ncbi:hypothetical protein LTR85_010960 [Meristemomyces frigidus]|nr:hypothetical protein LTR85_010960 [Meristemomyces frigidus]
MLTEQFVASIGVPEKPPATNIAKDAAIFIHEFQPLAAQRTVLKKSATPPNCLAVSDNHVFAAQQGKGVVNVYGRQKGNLEAVVPFTEHITCLALACDDTVLVLGTAEGRIFLWETCTGRQITTAQAHLNAVTALAVDPTSNFLLSASADSNVHVWAIPSLLSFANVGTEGFAQLSTFTSHREGVTALAVGHSSSSCNIAVTTSTDNRCLVWDYHTNTVLRTFLLPSVPRCVTLDAADRAVYVGYEDGSVQQLDLLSPGKADSAQLQSVIDSADGTVPRQPSTAPRWRAPNSSTDAALSIGLSFDSCTLLSGHQSGAVLAWDVASGRVQTNVLQIPLPGPVSNLLFLPVIGLPEKSKRRLNVLAVVKPKFGAFDSANGFVPGNYALNVELASNLHSTESAFQQALTAPSFGQKLIDEGLSELASWGKNADTTANGDATGDSEDFMALDGESDKPRQPNLEEQNAALKAQLESLRRLQTASFDKIDKINAERKALLQREQKRLTRRGAGKSNGVQIKNGNVDDELDETEESSDED